MQYRQLGKWGVRLSTAGLGSYLTIGDHISDEVSRQCVRRAIELGINWFDTANAYNRGRAEEVLGECLSEFPRDSFVLATKVYGRMGEGPNDRGLSAKHINEQCNASLRRLKMDYIDIYFCHRPDPHTPLEETIRAMEDLARQGKIFYWGVSEWPPGLIAEAVGLAREMNCRPPVVNQPRYSLLYRHPEIEVFPLCQKEGLGQVVFSPLAHGVLTGKYKPGEEPPAGTRGADPKQSRTMKTLYWGDEILTNVQAMAGIAKEMGLTTAQLAIAWCLHHPAVTSVILGATRVEQIEENVGASDVTIPDDVAEKLDELFPEPPFPGLPQDRRRFYPSARGQERRSQNRPREHRRDRSTERD